MTGLKTGQEPRPSGAVESRTQRALEGVTAGMSYLHWLLLSAASLMIPSPAKAGSFQYREGRLLCHHLPQTLQNGVDRHGPGRVKL
jgi:hypothetical protein